MRARTRRIGRPRPGTMTLWTVQPAEVWQRLLEHGSLWVDPNHPGFEQDFRESYDWLRDQMRQRVPGYGGGYPWWGYEDRPDLRQVRTWHPSGEPFVRLQLAVEPKRVLLSGYGHWHFVLSDRYLPPEDREQPLVPPGPEERARSWARIFDVDALRETNTIQACWERLDLADVVRVTEALGASHVAERHRGEERAC